MDDPVKILHEDKKSHEREQQEQRQKAEAELLDGSAELMERRNALRYRIAEPDALARSYDELLAKHSTSVLDVAQNGPLNQKESISALPAEVVASDANFSRLDVLPCTPQSSLEHSGSDEPK